MEQSKGHFRREVLQGTRRRERFYSSFPYDDTAKGGASG